MTATTTWDRQALSALVSKLSLQEKVAQLTGLAITDLMPRTKQEPTTPPVDVSLLPPLRPHGVGHLSLAWFAGADADSLRQSLATVQDAVRELSPFGIGALIHNEAVNGFLHASGSQFPTTWAQAASWDPSLTQRAAQVSADHLRHAGMHLAFAPVLDLARDPRWGRVHETYGEDPELVSQFGIVFVRGIQGTDADSGLVATAKPFAGYSASEGGLNQADHPAWPAGAVGRVRRAVPPCDRGGRHARRHELVQRDRRCSGCCPPLAAHGRPPRSARLRGPGRE